MPRDGSGVYTLPPGINGVPNATIESADWNTYTADAQTDANAARPIIAGGTGGGTAAEARDATHLKVPTFGMQITNYDVMPAEQGYIWSAAGATGAPAATAGHQLVGMTYWIDTNNRVVEVRDFTTGKKYTRGFVAGLWGAWAEPEFSSSGGTISGAITVNGASTLNGAVVINANTNPLTVNTTVNNGIQVSDGTRVGLIAPSSVGGISIGAITNHQLSLIANNAERVRISPNGNVLIGAGNAAGQLAIALAANQTNLLTYTNNDQTVVNFYAAQNLPSANAFWRSLDIVSAGSNTQSIIRFMTQQSSNAAPLETMRIHGANVGIGMVPTARFEVAGEVRANVAVNNGVRVTDGTWAGLFGPSGFGGLALGSTSALTNMYLFTASKGVGQWFDDTNSVVKIGYTTAAQVRFISHILPDFDNTQQCGIGSNRWTQVWAVNGTIQTSDEREKEMIADSDLGLAFINTVRPIVYREKTDDERAGDGQAWRYGVSAQQVQHALGGKPFAGLVYDETSGLWGTSYTSFVAPLITAVQELTARLEALEGATPR